MKLFEKYRAWLRRAFDLDPHLGRLSVDPVKALKNNWPLIKKIARPCNPHPLIGTKPPPPVAPIIRNKRMGIIELENEAKKYARTVGGHAESYYAGHRAAERKAGLE